ncbi:hypothetical protein ThimaDRAFT_4458 [Thiocapsa marina 5811]|uniref:Uncharacterized protein n=2 Tax=Thiocapsa marina TaxID=244573 RepID=F9UHQ5_9GAMM|nr:hypothetical protein ThimaDRAFT_4458 [Thiocapsa marina 5811]
MNQTRGEWISGRAGLINLIATIAMVSLVSGCATTRPADYSSAGFNPAAVDSVALLPILDHRLNQSKDLKLDKNITRLIEHDLKKKGYSYATERNRSLLSKVSRESLENPTPEFISALPPPSARWVLLFVVEDSASKLTFGSTGTAEMSGNLFDKASGSVAWRNREVAQIGYGGIAGMLVKGVMEESAVHQATLQMLQTLPSRKQ